jgi:tetratricopeptide (TPR) repeat protein
MLIAILAAAALAAADGPASASTVEVSGKGDTTTIEQGRDPLADKVDKAVTLISGGKAADAIPLLDEVIGAEEAGHKHEGRMIFSARTLTEAIVYSSMAGTQHKSAVVLDDTWSLGYFLKGYALVDLHRGNEAKSYLDKAIALSPMNAQYLAERGEWHKSQRDWTSSYADFDSASTAAEFSPDDSKSFEKRRALRGMAYARVEQGQLKEAENLLRACLKIDSSDEHAKDELEYIKSLSRSSS